MPTRRSLDKIKDFISAYRAAIIWAAFILLITLYPGSELPDINIWELNIEDKLAHVGIFAVLGFLMIYGSFKRNRLRRPNWFYILVFSLLVLLYGGLTEVMQSILTTTRFGNFGDFIADGIGAILGTVIAFWYFKSRRERAR